MDGLNRRNFVRFLAGSPLFAVAGAELGYLERLLHGTPADQSRALATIQQATQEPELIASASEALNVFDFEPVAHKKLPVAHWGYLTTGTDDDATIRANRAGFDRFDLRPRRLVDVTTIDMSTELLGVKWDTPIIINPLGSQRAFHPEGRNRRCPSGEGEGTSPDSVDRRYRVDRRRHRGARRASLVPVVSPAGLESDAPDAHARRARGVSSGRVHGRLDRRKQSRNDDSRSAPRYAKLRVVTTRWTSHAGRARRWRACG